MQGDEQDDGGKGLGTLEARDEVLARDTAAAVGLHALGPPVAAGGLSVPTEWIKRWHYDRPATWSYATASTLYGWLCLRKPRWLYSPIKSAQQRLPTSIATNTQQVQSKSTIRQSPQGSDGRHGGALEG